MLLLAVLLVQADDFARARERFIDGIAESRPDAVRATLDAITREGGEKAARALMAGLQKSRERFKLVERGIVDARRAHEKALEMPVFTDADKAARTKAVSDAKARVDGLTDALGRAEDVHEMIRRPFGTLRSEDAVAAVADELDRAGFWLARCELAEALGAMAPATAEKRLTERLGRETEEAVIATIIDSLGLRATLEPEGVRAVVGHLGSKFWQVQVAAARTLASTRSKSSVGQLVEAIRRTEGRAKNEVNAALKTLTRTDCFGDAAAWAEWWTANKADFEEGTYDPKQPRRPPGPGRTRFFDMEVESRRVCFVIDRSGSMKEGKPPKIDVVKAELKQLLAALPDGCRVNIVFFSDTIEAFSVATRPLDARNRKEALGFIDRQEARGGTNLQAALDRALGLVGSDETGNLLEDGIDTIYVLSDGAPSVGAVTDAETLVKGVTRRNRFLRATVNCIAVGDAEKVLKSLAESNGGESVQK